MHHPTNTDPSMRSFAPRLSATLLLLLLAGVASAGEHGFFGFALKAETKGFFLAPTLSDLGIDRVIPGTPAARAGIRAGDRIIEPARWGRHCISPCAMPTARCIGSRWWQCRTRPNSEAATGRPVKRV